MKSKKTRNVLVAAISTILVLVLGVGGFALYLAGEFDRNRGIVENAIKTATPTSSKFTPTAVPKLAQNILVMGTDTRGSLQGLDMTGTRSDTMMVVHIEAERKNVQVVSLPRDTWVKIKDNGKGKLNWAFSYGGAALAIDTVEDLLDIHIDHIVLIDFKGVVELSKVLNGVWVDNPRQFTNGRDASKIIYTFKKGRIKLKGQNALAFTRERHALPGGDGDRVKNQQLFVQGVVNRLLEAEVLANPATLVELSRTIGKLVRVNPEMNSSWIMRTALELKDFKLQNLRTFTLPLSSTGNEGQHYVVYTSKSEIAKLSAAFKTDTLDDYVLPPEIQTRN
jgi:LCP family protein required for cell wall assembly